MTNADAPEDPSTAVEHGGDGITAPRGVLIAALLALIAELRRENVAVSADASVTAARAVSALDVYSKTTVRTALRAAVISNPKDYQRFDEVFETFWPRFDRVDANPTVESEERVTATESASAGASTTVSSSGADASDRQGTSQGSSRRPKRSWGENPQDSSETKAPVYSQTGRSQAIAVNANAVEPTEPLQRSFGRFSRSLATVHGRRTTAGMAQIDGRRLLRESLSTGGIPLELPTRDRQLSEVKAVFLVDVSRSVLETIDPGFLLQFLRLAHAEWRHVRTFLFDTEVREVTEQLGHATPEQAVSALQQADLEWGGGTQIGGAIASVRNQIARDIDRDSVITFVSDGLEVGDIELLRDGMAWLSRRSERVLWLNPLAALEGYEATCEGMKATLPYVDAFFPFAEPDDLNRIATLLCENNDGTQYT